jgi:hypothetical protein
MEFKIDFSDKIRVFKEGELFLYADFNNWLRMHLRFFKNGKLILETSYFGIFLFYWVQLKQQALPFLIESARQKGIFGFLMEYDSRVICTIQRAIRNPTFQIYLDDIKVGEAYYPKWFTPNRQFIVKTTIDDEITNVYLLLAFLIQQSPPG